MQGDASAGGEAVEDKHRERGDACLGRVARRVMEGDQAVGVPVTSTRWPPVRVGSDCGQPDCELTEAMTSRPASSSVVSRAGSSSVITSASIACLSRAYSAKGR